MEEEVGENIREQEIFIDFWETGTRSNSNNE